MVLILLMKTLKILAALVLLLAGTGIKAQTVDNGRYIEVTVTDSVNMMPDLIEYTVSLRAKQEYATYDYENYEPASTDNVDQQLDAKAREEKLKIELQVNEKKFIQLLEKEKIVYTREESKPSPYNYNIYMPGAKNMKEKSFVLKFKSLEQVEAFTSKIPEDLYHDGMISNMICTKQQVLEDKLLEKLMVKAKKQAEKIATVSNVKLGGLQQFSDNTDNNLVKGLTELYMSFMSMYEREKFMNNSKTLQVRKTARVRFAVE